MHPCNLKYRKFKLVLKKINPFPFLKPTTKQRWVSFDTHYFTMNDECSFTLVKSVTSTPQSLGKYEKLCVRILNMNIKIRNVSLFNNCYKNLIRAFVTRHEIFPFESFDEIWPALAHWELNEWVPIWRRRKVRHYRSRRCTFCRITLCISGKYCEIINQCSKSRVACKFDTTSAGPVLVKSYTHIHILKILRRYEQEER